MNRKMKLAKLILIESESLQTVEGIDNTLSLIQEVHKDAIELAKMIMEEEKEAS